MTTKAEIISTLEQCEKANSEKIADLSKKASLTDYEHLVTVGVQNGTQIKIWSDALQTALNENEIVTIPESADKYYIDKTVTIPSNRRILADKDAHISLTADAKVLMMRNEHTMDGTHYPIPSGNEDCNISIDGGYWEEENTKRLGYGESGMYDEDRSFFGVSTCMLFDNIIGLTLTNMVFVQTAGFAVQIGDIKNAIFRDIRFENCFADGIHVNGNSENIIVQNLSGQVGDDFVALNMYDWQNSSINFGPLKNALVENIVIPKDSRCKALRLQPGIYYYDDDSQVDCSINNLIVRNVKGLRTIKFYYQTPRYKIGTPPERGDTGSGDNIFFENIDIDLDRPVDALEEYMNSDPVRGAFAGIEVGSNIKNISFTNVNLTLYKDKYPLSYLLCIGPKSCIQNGDEIFDPYVNSVLENLTLENISINGEKVTDLSEYIHVTEFNDLNKDGHSTAKGVIKNITVK